MGAMLDWAAVRSQAQIRHVSPVRPGAAQDLVARVYQQAERDFGMVAPPLSLHSSAPGPLAACWLMLRETLLATGHADRASKEAVAAAVSLGNACPYCVAVHSATLHGLARGRVAAAIAEDRVESIADPRLRRIAEWARGSGTRDATAPREPPFPAEQAPELIGVAVTFHYLNRMVSIFLPESPLPPGVPAAFRGGLLRMVGRLTRRIADRKRPPGVSLDLLPAAPLPADLSWAAGNHAIAEAFARAANAIDAAGNRSVPVPVRDLVRAELDTWNGQPPGPSRAWSVDALAGLPAALRPAGRLALLTALAPYQIGQSVIDEFRRDQADDESLVELTSWASLAAARRVGGWNRAGWQAPARPVAGSTEVRNRYTAGGEPH